MPDNPAVPVIRSKDIPALLAYFKTLPSHLKPGAEQVSPADVFGVAPTANVLMNCFPGSCAIRATVKLDDPHNPVLQYWEMQGANGPEWALAYVQDNVDRLGLANFDAMAVVILPDGTFSKTFMLQFTIGIDPKYAFEYSYYYSLLARPEYANIVDLVKQ